MEHEHVHGHAGEHGECGEPRQGHRQGGHEDHGSHMVADFKKRFRIAAILTLPLLALSPMIRGFLGMGEEPLFPGELYAAFILASVIFFYGGYPFLAGMLGELKERAPGMMTLVAVAVTTAYVYSSLVVFGLAGKDFFWELATLIDIMLLGHWVEMRSVLGASGALKELARLIPPEAHRQGPGGRVEDVPVEELVVGDRVVVKPGEKVPADGVVVEGATSVDEAVLTGESTPVSKRPGSKVIGGAVNGEGSVTVEVTKTGKDSFVSQVVELVRAAQESKSKTQVLADRAAAWLTFIALGSGTATFVAWAAASDRPLHFALERAVTVMVIACPHALGLAVPLVVAVSTTLGARSGLLVRNRAAFERARGVQAVVFDKTGTLTEGRFGVTRVVPLDDRFSSEQVLRYAVAVEARSEHPIARGIVAEAGDVPPVEAFKAMRGRGVEGRVEGKLVRVVSRAFLSEEGVHLPAQVVDDPSLEGQSMVFLTVDGKVVGAVVLSDVVRRESREAVAVLKSMGIACMMLTGDDERVAKRVAEELGLDEYFAKTLPDAKADKIRQVQARGLIVAMTGDGVNDAPALATADVGIAIGAGTDVAVETADIVLVRSNPLDVVAAIRLARATHRKMAQNLAWAAGYNAVAIPLAAGVLYKAGVLLSPAVGAVLMSISTVIVAVNAGLMRLSGFAPRTD